MGWEVWEVWEGVELVDCEFSLSTLQDVTVTKPAPRPSGFGESRRRRTRSGDSGCTYALYSILARSPEDPQRIRVASVFELFFVLCSLFFVLCGQIF